MDPNRFDRLSRAFASGLTRRQMVGGLGAGGLTAALFAPRAEAASIADDRTCTYDFTATVDLGPSSGRKSSREIVGELRLTVGPGGAIDQGTLTVADGSESAVVGQAVGRAVNLRISLAGNQTIVAVGTAQFPVVGCKGQMGGPLTGPQRHDVGDWTASPKKTGPTPTPASTPSTAATAVPVAATVVPEASPPPSTDTAASTCDLQCGGDTLGLDEANCVCGCPSGMTTCVAEIGSIPGKGGVIFNGPSVKFRTGYCVDVATDTSHCGACGNVCPSGANIASATCSGGRCHVECAKGFDDCSRAGAEQCLTDLGFDDLNCGGCGQACPPSFICANGGCRCGIVCGPDQTLDENACVCSCAVGTACGSACVDVASDPGNCGACGNVCRPFEPSCAGGGCGGVLDPNA
ncbi:MAG: hypothetical protein ACR2OO_15545 [Thermomicrobiales bacterium]